MFLGKLTYIRRRITMNERFIRFASFTMLAQADADGVDGAVYVPKDVLFTHSGHCLTQTGSPTTATIDIQDDASDIVTATAIGTPALATLTTPVRIAAGSKIELDLNLLEGSTPKSSGRVDLWGYVSE